MATLVTVLTLVALVRLCDLGFKPLELALFLMVIAGAAQWGLLPLQRWLLDVAGTFTLSAAWFWSLQASDHIGGQGLHWLLLIGGFVLLLGARLYLDLIVYGAGF
ncbi:hypothetical protein [Methylibium sp.]|uniref:hypothetical protein n=1 Tax=Methylibium sp. TaxID=2067992 RepID=UPI00286BB445|nr:hypothetical protein [Methylibium sp.]